jgi:phosphatidylserine decarboxylase
LLASPDVILQARNINELVLHISPQRNYCNAMKYSGKARSAALRLMAWPLAALLALAAVCLAAPGLGPVARPLLLSVFLLWLLFTIFTLYFFRDPEARVPQEPGLLVSPGHGKVDMIDRLAEPQFMGGECQRISIFLSVFNVHVQNSPVSGKLAFYKYTTGQFLNALKAESAAHNENALLGIQADGGAKIGVRLLAGLIARRIVPFVSQGEDLDRGQRISLIQFGSRVDLYLPLSAEIKVKLGENVVGGETIMAKLK